MAGNKPAFKVQAKSKNTDTRVNILAVWDNNGRLSGTLDRDVVAVKVKLPDGSVVELTNDHAWFNVYDNREDNEQNQTQTPTQKQTPPTSNQAYDVPAGGDGGDVPF